ncbi:efflux RND transporter periplasmic adaptor subunit [Paenibacillus sp. P96]|uniref:Efflux RND transporter periplasmic adaptor subunit n=1 Tax=Paenibacillus zeirhizosphaerae TaxID=2987519 RepID=A0ABT9FV62_9BACL|nr:efflux RND transporter periplasmic adaptor subunit [Paenibacillus sp. P96]MDP4098611.1 efflux RND transporter periplasmic adaptor subunit [Paenibacillus sp. P96]
MNQNKFPFLLPALLAIAIATVGCSAEQPASDAAVEANGTFVDTMVVKQEPLNTVYDLSGTLQAYEERALSFENGGRVTAASPAAGAAVSQGSILAQLDQSNYRLQLAQAEAAIQEMQAAVANAEAGIRSASSSLASAEAQVESAQANVRKVNKGARKQEKAQAQAAVDKAQSAYEKIKADADRIRQLYEAGAASASDYENAQLQLISAEKDLETARDSLSLLLEGATPEDTDTAEAALKEAVAGKSAAEAAQLQARSSKEQAEASYEKAKVAKEQAELALSRTTLSVPFDGVVLEKLIEPGELVASGQTIYRIGSIDQLKVLLPVPDSEIQEWKKGQKVSISLYGQTRTASVSAIYAATNANTGTINAEVVIPNPAHDWMPGQVVKAARGLSSKQGLLVPVEAVIQTGDQPYVFREVDGKAVKTTVELGGQMTGNKLQIISGLNEGDHVVTKGGSSLFNGDTLQPTGGDNE